MLMRCLVVALLVSCGGDPSTSTGTDSAAAPADAVPAWDEVEDPADAAPVVAAGDARVYVGEPRHYGPPLADGSASHPVLSGWFFRPDGPMPAGGFACVAVARLAGHRTNGASERLTPAAGLPYRLVHEAGIAVFFVLLPPSRSDLLDDLSSKDQSAEGFDPAAGSYGPPYGRGAGAVVPARGVVGVDWPGPPPPGLTGTHPWLDPAWLMPEKAAAAVVQHLRFHGIGGTGELPVDPDRLGLDGSSSGGTAMLFPGLMPDLAGRLGSDDPQSLVSTRVDAVRVGGAPTYWPLFRRDGVYGRFKAYHFARLDSAPLYDEPATDFHQATRDGAELEALSPAIYGSDLGGTPGLTALNTREVQLYLAYNEPSNPRVLATPDRWVWPFPTDLEQRTHPASQGYILKALYPGNARLIIGKADAVDSDAATTGGGAPADAVITDKQAAADDAFDWWRRVLGAADG